MAPGFTQQVAHSALWLRLSVAALVLVATLLLLPQFKSDFAQSYAAARGWWEGHDPNGQTSALLAGCCPALAAEYPEMQTAHPPFATLIALPLGRLPWATARLAWLAGAWLAITVAWLLDRTDPWACAATACLWMLALGLGTHEPLLFLLLALAIRVDGGEPRTENREPRAAWNGTLLSSRFSALVTRHSSLVIGLLVGLCAAIKAYPALLIVGLWLSGRRAAATAAVATLAAATLLSELVLGFGATVAWLRWTPANTARYVDTVDNLSLVRLVRELAPGVSALALALVLFVLLLLPLLPNLRRGKWLRPLLPVLLLVSPLSWRHYLGLSVLCRPAPLELGCLALGGFVAILAGMGALPPDNLALVIQGPLLLALLLLWYRQARVSSGRAHKASR